MRPPCSAISRTNRLLMNPSAGEQGRYTVRMPGHGVVGVRHLLLDLEVAGVDAGP